MVLSLSPRKEPLMVIEDLNSSNDGNAVEHVVFHQSRGSIVCIRGDTLEEVDVQTGALLCHIAFDLLVSGTLDLILPAGPHFVVGLFQSRLFVVWDLDQAVLLLTCDADKVHGARRVTALATSLCVDRWLFFNAEGSNNVRVTRVDSQRSAREILRKSSLRGGSVTSLAYSTEHHFLSSGCNDGTIQVWSIGSDEAEATTRGKKGQEASEFATPLFAVQLTQSPVVKIVIGTGTYGSSRNIFLAAGYQNRRVDIVAINGQAYTCVASTILTPPETPAFSRISGTLSLAIHEELPLLLVHWHSHRSEFGGNVIAAWEFNCSDKSATSSSSGSTGGNSIHGDALTDWWSVANSSALCPCSTTGSQPKAPHIIATDMTLWQNSLAVYASTMDRRSIVLLDIQSSLTSPKAELKMVLALSTTMQLTLAQYHDYPATIPSSQLQIAVTTSAKGTPVLKLQRYSQLTGRLIASSDQLLDWKSTHGVPLVPFQVIGTSHQSIVCLKLREKGFVHGADQTTFSFALLDLDSDVDPAKNDGVTTLDDEDGAIALSALPALELKCGPLQHDVRDVCFGMNPTTNINAPVSKHPAYLLVVLSSTGDMLTLQNPIDLSTKQLRFNQPILRVFPTPMLLPASSLNQTESLCKLLYLLQSVSDGNSQQLVLSGEDLSIPLERASSWTCEAQEHLVDVQWNTSSCPESGPHDSQQRLLLAVRTTRRLVVLSPELCQLRAYTFRTDLNGTPESLLWVSQTLMYVTTEHQVRYVTPVANHLETSRLLCSLAVDLDSQPGFTQSLVQLVSICGDRLCYTVTNPATLATRATLHSVALCEPLLLGFAYPNATLRRVFEREIVAFTLLSDESDRPVCSITDVVLETAYHSFGWKDKVLKALNALITSQENSTLTVGTADGGVARVSHYSRASVLSTSVMGSIFLDAHQWEDFVRVFLAQDPVLEEYVVAIDSDGGGAKLPSKMGPMARRFRELATVFTSIGQPDWAIRCLDLSGDDEALLTLFRLLHTASDSPSSTEVLEALEKAWAQLNPPLSTISKAATKQMQQDPETRNKHDLFLLLCCETLTQPTRRGRLLTSVAPYDRLKLSIASNEKLLPQDKSVNETTRPGTLPWKRLAPEDASEWVGVSGKIRFATCEPRALNYSLFDTEISTVIGGADIGQLSPIFSPIASVEVGASAKMTIGPFQDEEDAVVAYWRFEEGSTVAEKQLPDDAVSNDGIECLDSSKRENTLRLLGGVVNFVESSAPVDRGEPGRIPEEFALRFPSSTTPASSLPVNGWGAQCPVRPGSTLDIATTFDEDPYRREFTFEAWIRNYKMHEHVQSAVESGDESPASRSDGVRQVLVARRRVDTLNDREVLGPESWQLVVDEDDHLVLVFGNQQIRASRKIEHSGNQGWHHVAFTVDVSSPQRVGLSLFLDARSVGEAQITPLPQTTLKGSKLFLGWRLQDYEMTEVRLWATARSADQLSDMRENYLSLVEAKRRMKIAIHQRNCTCEKCVARRAQASAGATGANGTPRLGLPLSTPLAPPSRQRRVVPQAKPTS